MKNTPCERREKHYVEHHIDFLSEEMNKLKGRSGHMDVENVRALSDAMKNQMKESESREAELRDRIQHLERLKAKSEEKLLEFAETKGRERTEDEKRRDSQRRQNEEKITELERNLYEKETALSSLMKDHDRLLEKCNRLNNDHAIEVNDAKNKEANLKNEIELIRKERDSLKLEYGRLNEDLSRHAAVISSFKAAELGIRNDIADKNQEILRLQEKVNELEKIGEKSLNDLENEKENYAKCYAQVQQYQSNNMFLEKTAEEFAEKLSTQSREFAQEREKNNSLICEVKRLCDVNEQQDKAITDLNEQTKKLNDVIVKDGQKEHSLSLKFNSCIDQMELMENQLAESQQIFLHERHSKEEAEKSVQDLSNEVNILKKEKEELAQELNASQNKCVKLDAKRRELSVNLKCTTEQNTQRFSEVEGQLSKERARTMELVQENEQKAELIRKLQEDVNTNVKTAVSIEKVNEIFSVELDKMVAKCQNLEKCQTESVELRSELVQVKDAMESVIRKEREESDVLRKRIDTLSKAAEKLSRENEECLQVERKHLEKINLIENEKVELTMMVNELLTKKNEHENEKQKIEVEIQRVKVINEELSAEYEKALDINKVLKKDNAHYDSSLSQMKRDLQSATKKAEVILSENEQMYRQMEESKIAACENFKQQSVQERSIRTLESQLAESKSENQQMERERTQVHEEQNALRQTAEEQQKNLADCFEREEELKRQGIRNIKELEKSELNVKALTKQVEQLATKLSLSHHQEMIHAENVKNLEKRISNEEEEHELTRKEKERSDQALKSLSDEFKSYFQKFEQSETNSEKQLKEIEQLSHQLNKINHDVSIGKSMLADKTAKVESLDEENLALASANRQLENELRMHKKASDDLNIKHNKALLEISSLKDQYEKNKREGENADFSLREAMDKNSQYEMETNKLKVSISALKEKLNDQQRVIDEFDYKESMKLQHKENKDVEIRTLKTSNSDLQNQVHQLKEEVARQKVQTDKYKEECMSRKVEVDNTLQENEKLRRQSSNHHEPCKNKIMSLESKVEGLREKELREKKKFNQLKHEYESIGQFNKELQSNFKSVHRELSELREEHLEKSTAVEKHMKIHETETSKLNEMKGEYAKLVFILRRIKKNYDDLKGLLKIVEKEKVQVRLENEQLVTNANNLRQNLDESTAEKMKVYSDNQKLKASLNLLKYYDSARQADQRTLADRLQKSEMQLSAILTEKTQKTGNPDKEFSLKPESCYCSLLGKLMDRAPKSEMDKDSVLTKLLSEFEDTMNRKTVRSKKSKISRIPRRSEPRIYGARGDALSSSSSLDSFTEKLGESRYNRGKIYPSHNGHEKSDLTSDRRAARESSSTESVAGKVDDSMTLQTSMLDDLLRIL